MYRLRAVVVSVKEKSCQRIMAGKDQGDERNRTIDEVSKHVGWRQNWRAIVTPALAQGKPVYCLGGVRHKSGITLIQTFAWNLGICKMARYYPAFSG
jgi:hypothetical protein